MISPTLIGLSNLIAAVLFIWTKRDLASPVTARRGNTLCIIGMALVVVTTLLLPEVQNFGKIIAGILLGAFIGTWIAKRAKMTELPQLIALFNGFVGLGGVFVSIAAFFDPAPQGLGRVGDIDAIPMLELGASVLISAVTFTGSMIAFGKLQGLISNSFLNFKKQYRFNIVLLALAILVTLALPISQSATLFYIVILLSLLLGITIVTPIGGADMPVVISMLNAYSGFASVAVGFTLQNTLMIIVGSLIGLSGMILSYIMCKNMNRSFINVIVGGLGDSEGAGASAIPHDKNVRIGSAEDAAFIMKNAQDVIIIPGYGMAVAQAQHAVKEMADMLKKEGVRVRYAIHPVAGRMPGHMNVLLAEANVPYDDVFELEDINREFAQCDVAFVVGANDITNPAAKDDPSSPIFGMPILDVSKAKTVLFVKRSLASGYAGIDNTLFYQPNTMMLLDNAKKMVENVIKAL
jgi:NAD(P) transhydrogenase subunit beta